MQLIVRRIKRIKHVKNALHLARRAKRKIIVKRLRARSKTARHGKKVPEIYTGGRLVFDFRNVSTRDLQRLLQEPAIDAMDANIKEQAAGELSRRRARFPERKKTLPIRKKQLFLPKH